MTARRSRLLVAAVAAVALLTTACHDSKRAAARGATTSAASDTAASTTTTSEAIGPAIIFTAQGTRLDAYATTPPFVRHTVVPSPAASRDGVDVSGQICFDPSDPRRFVAVDQTAATDGQSGWGVFELSGRALAKISAKEIARLVPSYQPTNDGAGPTPFGCGFLADGRLLTTDVGNAATGAANGQLIEWFPPFDQDVVSACKIDVALAAPMTVLVDGDSVYVAENRGRGVTRFDATTFPASNRPTDGCAATDSTGHRLASGIVPAPWLRNPIANGMTRPAGIAAAGNGNFYVSVPSSGVIAEVSGAGDLVRRVLVPPAHEVVGRQPFSTGTPLGLAVGPGGTLYYADAGFIDAQGALVPKLRAGTVRRITFVGGVPQRPEVVDSGLTGPTGIAIWTPGR